MYHISANLAFGRREKNIRGTKSSRGRQIVYKRAPKKLATFFSFFDIKFSWGANKINGAPDGNVTPWLNYAKHLWVKLYMVIG